MATDTAPGRRLAPEARREQLIALGLELIKERPFDQVLVDEVIAAAGISKGLLFHYFPSKKAYQEAVVEAACAELVAVLDVPDDLEVGERLRVGLDGYVAYLEENQSGYIAIVRGAGSDDALLAVFERTRDTIVEIIVAGILDAGLAADESPLLRLAVRGWIASVEESTVLWLRDQPCTRDELLALLMGSALLLAPMVTGLSR